MAKLLCRLFGHRRFSGWFGDGLYGRVEFKALDGLGEFHFAVTADCDHCGERYVLARFHGSNVLRAIPEHMRPQVEPGATVDTYTWRGMMKEGG